MMLQNNSSLASLSTKDKQLPAVPPEDELLVQKTFNRKNQKHLLLDPPAPDSQNDFLRFQNLKLQQKRNKVRPAPLLNLAPSQPTVLDSFQSLELGLPGKDVQRKRQTVISSISPTKSVYTPSPREATLPILSSASSQTLPLTTPITTTSALNLCDKDLVHLKDLGSGNSGVVLKVLHVPLQKTMARKVVHIETKMAVQTQIIRELRIMHECRSPYIIEFYGAFVRSNNTIVLCMEYCNCGSLDKIQALFPLRQFPVPVLKKLLHLILQGLTYLYDTHKIIHRDIKPSNVLMTHRGEFKLCDFGVSRELTNSLAMADTFVGTSTYMSPERIQGLNYGINSDVWSMGLMLFELASGSYIWSDDEGGKPAGPHGILDLLQRIVNELPPTLANKTNRATKQPFDADLTEFIDACLIKDDSLRQSPQELLDRQSFLRDVERYDKDVKAWAKMIRKLHKMRNEEALGEQ